MNYILNDFQTGCVIMNYETETKKRKLNPITSVSVFTGTEITIGDQFVGNQNTYTVGEIIERRKQNISGRDLITFKSTT